MRNTITVRMTDEMIAKIDTLIAAQGGYISRQEVVRRLLDVALSSVVQLPAAGKTPDGKAQATRDDSRSDSDPAEAIQTP